MNNEIVFYRRFGDIDGDTLLHFAAATGRYNLLIKYLNAGNDINVVNNLGWTPLMQACRNGHYSCVKFLIENGANIETNNYFGTCLLALAVASGDLEIVKFIFKTLCKKELINEVVKNNYPIIYSIISKNNEILKHLLKYKFNLYRTSAIGGLLPLEIAKRINNTTAMSLIHRRSLSPLDMSKISPNNSTFLCPLMMTKNARPRTPSNVNISTSPSTPNWSPIERTTISKNSRPRTSSNMINNAVPLTPTFSPIACNNQKSYYKSPRKAESRFLETNKVVMTTSQYVSKTTTEEFMFLHSNSLTAPTFHTRHSSTTSMFSYKTYETKEQDDVFANSSDASILSPSHDHFINLLRRHSLDSCVSLFEEHEIDMDLFLTLSKNDLNEIGVDWDKRDAVLELIFRLNKQKMPDM